MLDMFDHNTMRDRITLRRYLATAYFGGVLVEECTLIELIAEIDF